MKTHYLLTLLVTSTAGLVHGQLGYTNVAIGRLDTSIVKVVRVIPDVPVSPEGLSGRTMTLYSVRVLDSNRFKPNDQITLFIRRPYGSPMPVVGQNYLVSSAGAPASEITTLLDAGSNEKREVASGEHWVFDKGGLGENTVWTNFALPTPKNRLLARKRTMQHLVENMLDAIQGMTYIELANYAASDIYPLARGFVVQFQDQSKSPLMAGIDLIAARSTPEKAALLHQIRMFGRVLGADRDYAQSLVRLSAATFRTWRAGDFSGQIEPYTLLLYRGREVNRPTSPLTTEEAVAASCATRYPELATHFGNWIRRPNKSQISRLQVSLKSKDPEVVAAIMKSLPPEVKKQISAKKS